MWKAALRTAMVVLALILLPMLIVSGQGECYGDESCYDLPPDAPASSGGSPGDDRLNYVPDEYYTVYCHNDVVDVWRGVPDSLQIGTIPISLILSMTVPQSAGHGLGVSRSGDTVTIYGTNGNGPTHPGSKSFSLAECIDRNGGVPTVVPTEPHNERSPDTTGIGGADEARRVCDYPLHGVLGWDGHNNSSTAPSVIGDNGECQRPPDGAACTATVTFLIGDTPHDVRVDGTVMTVVGGDVQCRPFDLTGLLYYLSLEAASHDGVAAGARTAVQASTPCCAGVFMLPLGVGILRLKRRLKTWLRLA